MKLPLLHPRQTIALVCTGTAASSEQIALKTRDYLSENYQLNVLHQHDTYQRLPAIDRAGIFLEYLFSDKVDGIWALRGGEGTADIIPYLEQQRTMITRLPPKLLMGFSDFTPLLLYFAQNFHWPVVHGMGAIQLVENKLDANSRKMTADLLFGVISEVTLSGLLPLNPAAESAQTLIAPVSGGNLSLLDISIKDRWELQAQNKVLIIEDVNEKAHKISRTLKYLQRIGSLQETVAIIFGDFCAEPIGKTETEIHQNAVAIHKVVKEFAQSCDFPVLYTEQFGHGRTNYPIIFGKPATLYLGNDAKLVMPV